jgi:hypothetical protein
MSRIAYDAATVQGKILSEAVDHLVQGRALLKRWADAADVATNTGPERDYTQLEGGAFGAVSGGGQALYDAGNGIKTLLNDDDAGGLWSSLAQLDNGG